MLPFSYLPREKAGCSLSACVIAVKYSHMNNENAHKRKAYSNASGRTKVKLVVNTKGDSNQ